MTWRIHVSDSLQRTQHNSDNISISGRAPPTWGRRRRSRLVLQSTGILAKIQPIPPISADSISFQPAEMLPPRPSRIVSDLLPKIFRFLRILADWNLTSEFQPAGMTKCRYRFDERRNARGSSTESDWRFSRLVGGPRHWAFRRVADVDLVVREMCPSEHWIAACEPWSTEQKFVEVPYPELIASPVCFGISFIYWVNVLLFNIRGST